MNLAPARTETFNVGSGEPVTIEAVLRILVGLARVAVKTELDPERVRPGEPTVLALDASRFRARTGWEPKVPLDQSLADTLDHLRALRARPRLAPRVPKRPQRH